MNVQMLAFQLNYLAKSIKTLTTLGAATDFLTTLPEIAKAIADMIVTVFTSISSIFYTPGTPAVGEAAAVSGEITFIGVMCLMVLFIGLAFLILNWVRGLLSKR